MKKKVVVKFWAVLLAASLAATSAPFQGLGTVEVFAASELSGSVLATVEHAFDATSWWDSVDFGDFNLTTTTAPADGTVLAMDVLIPVEGNEGGVSFSGCIKAMGVLRVGSNWDWVQSNSYPEVTADSFYDTVTVDGAEYYRARVQIPFSGTVGANVGGAWNDNAAFSDAVTDAISAVTITLAGAQCDYEGTLAIANAQLLNTEGSNMESSVVKSWTFDNGTDGWSYAGWEWQYDGETPSVTWDSAEQKLALLVDYSKNGGTDWSQFAIQSWGDIDVKGANATTFDFYYDESLVGSGGFWVKEVLQYYDEAAGSYASAAEQSVSVSMSGAVDATEDGLPGYKKVTVSVSFDTVTEDICNVALCLVGSRTTYAGTLYLDNIQMLKAEEKADSGVDSTVAVSGGNPLTVSGTTLTLGNGAAETLADTITLVDSDATDAAKATYAYLQAVGESDSLIYGHQDDTWQKAGSSSLSSSDTFDVTGSIAGVVGMDVLTLVGNEYSADRYNAEIAAKNDEIEAVDTEGQSTAEANVEAAAKLANLALEDGAILTLSAHMPNFSLVLENASYNAGTDPSYAKYDFSGYTPNTLTGDVMNEILPGGAYSEMYNAYLDMIADFANQVDGAILFRPFHENTGSWFWWGADFCDAEQYKNVYRYTVEYLRDTRNVHNMIYVYGPSSDAESTEQYAERYPGDAYVDMVGFDMYDLDPVSDEDGYAFLEKLQAELEVVNTFASEHGKLLAVTETGMSSSTTDEGHGQTALHDTGNQQLDWYNKELEVIAGSDACYMLLWANFSKKDGYYTPYVDRVNEDGTLHGHEELDYFISFYNDERTIFAGDQKDALASIDGAAITAESAADALLGYFLTPVAGKRILSSTTLTAKLSAETDEDITFVLQGKKETVILPAKKDGKTVSAELDEEALAALGATLEGTIQLCAGERVLQTISVIFNIAEPVEDPYEVDGFENYYGIESLLNEKWTGYHADGSTIAVSLTEEQAYDGDYAMQFAYHETTDGWAGVTMDKTADWSACSAISFYTIPDGNNQKTVVQITANNTVYEVYLNQYADYAADTDGTPLLVTIPFADFCERDTEGNPTGGLVEDAAYVTSFGLWVNAIADSGAVREDGMVEGVIIYDKIVAVSTDAQDATFVPVTDDADPDNEGESQEPETDSGEEDNKEPETGSEEEDNQATETGSGEEDKTSAEDNKSQQSDKTSDKETSNTSADSTMTEGSPTDEKAADGGTNSQTIVSSDQTGSTTGQTTASSGQTGTNVRITITGTAHKTGTKASLKKKAVTAKLAASGSTAAETTVVATVKKENGKTAFTLKTTASNLKNGTKLHLYALENGSYTAVDAKTYTVSNGTVSVTASEKKTYVLLNDTEAKKAGSALLKTVKAKKSAVTMKTGATKAFELSSKLNSANIKSITYSTTAKSVATVSGNGKITAKKAGTATVKAKVILKNGATKTVSMKVTVK